ncbi:hypothetical protein [Acetobacter sp. DsW_063]|uniref:hypothetical protein n=1 Tax=Acetobacter sp. DsW_063 TaxID=1514894 RepID=UPI000A371731|nr:hypothetical protein [Acetobacter sp. DsW_063]OUJ11620.1 hypothetical protein HK28_04550 [Acetobacter sp. DsW_063]
MRIFEVGKSAMQAEGQLLQQKAMRLGRQVALLLVGAVLGFFSLITGHALLWAIFLFKFGFGPVGAPAAVFGVDVFLALFFIFLGRRSYLLPAEVEARMKRDRALNELRQTATLTAMGATVTGPVARFAGRSIWGLVSRRRGR